MRCSALAAEAVPERYLLGQLTDEEQSAYEQHYFDCAPCFDDLQALQAAQTALRGAERTPRRGPGASPLRKDAL